MPGVLEEILPEPSPVFITFKSAAFTRSANTKAAIRSAATPGADRTWRNALFVLMDHLPRLPALEISTQSTNR